MLYVVAAVGLIAAFVLWTATRTASLNNDPRQQQLATKMMSAIEEGREYQSSGTHATRYQIGPDGEHVRVGPKAPQCLEFAWQEKVIPYFVGLYGQMPYGARQTRSAHALSMIRSSLTTHEYELLKASYCRVLPSYSDESWVPATQTK